MITAFRKYLPNILRSLGITGLAFILSTLIIAPFSASTSSIFSSPEKSDSVLSDFFAQIANRRPVREISNRIVMIDIDRAGREEIAGLLELVSMCNPEAVGLDVLFEDKREDDSRLSAAIESTPNLVVPIGLHQLDDGTFEISEKNFFHYSIPGLHFGATNMPGIYVKSTIREFPVHFREKEGEGFNSFVAEVLSVADPEKYNDLIQRGREYETIDYASMEIPVMSIEEVYDNPETIVGKIVMIGAADAASDSHATPIRSSMSGLEIHSHALSTALRGTYYTSIPKAWDYIAAGTVCFVLVFLSLTLKAKVKGLFLRLLQLLLIYGIVRFGYELYVSKHIVANFSVTMIMVAFGFFAIDFWNGAIGIWEITCKWFGKFKSKHLKGYSTQESVMLEGNMQTTDCSETEGNSESFDSTDSSEAGGFDNLSH